MIPLTLSEISKSIGAQIKNVDSSLKITGKVEQAPKMEGKQMTFIIQPLK